MGATRWWPLLRLILTRRIVAATGWSSSIRQGPCRQLSPWFPRVGTTGRATPKKLQTSKYRPGTPTPEWGPSVCFGRRWGTRSSPWEKPRRWRTVLLASALDEQINPGLYSTALYIRQGCHVERRLINQCGMPRYHRSVASPQSGMILAAHSLLTVVQIQIVVSKYQPTMATCRPWACVCRRESSAARTHI